tara:strand:- start:60 stop:521 length:462 start_codon:yes stop_codon:yes gene_type:complete
MDEITNKEEILDYLSFDDNNVNFYLILGIIIIIVVLLNIFNFKSSYNLDVNKDPIELIKETHMICPVTNKKATISSCVQYPPLNEGFIVSTCCKTCIETIQFSFDAGDGIYSIKEENGMNVLYNHNNLKQITPICNNENMKLIFKLTSNKSMD